MTRPKPPSDQGIATAVSAVLDSSDCTLKVSDGCSPRYCDPIESYLRRGSTVMFPTPDCNFYIQCLREKDLPLRRLECYHINTASQKNGFLRFRGRGKVWPAPDIVRIEETVNSGLVILTYHDVPDRGRDAIQEFVQVNLDRPVVPGHVVARESPSRRLVAGGYNLRGLTQAAEPKHGFDSHVSRGAVQRDKGSLP